MRGSPILRALVALLVLLALGWPLQRLLQAGDAGESGTAPAAEKVEPKRLVHLQVSFTQPPAVLRVHSLGETVWTAEAPGLEVEHDLTLTYPKEGVDLVFDVDWPADLRAAAKVVLTDPAGVEHTGFLMGSGKTTDVLTFR